MNKKYFCWVPCWLLSWVICWLKITLELKILNFEMIFFSQCMYNVVETGKGFVTCHWCHSSLLGRMTFSQVLWDSAKTGDSIQWGMVYQATESMQANWCISTDFCTNLQPCTCQRKEYILLIAKPHCYFPPQHGYSQQNEKIFITQIFFCKWIFFVAQQKTMPFDL